MGESSFPPSCNNVVKYWHDKTGHAWFVLKKLKIKNVEKIFFKIDKSLFCDINSPCRPIRIFEKQGVNLRNFTKGYESQENSDFEAKIIGANLYAIAYGLPCNQTNGVFSWPHSYSTKQ